MTDPSLRQIAGMWQIPLWLLKRVLWIPLTNITALFITFAREPQATEPSETQ